MFHSDCGLYRYVHCCKDIILYTVVTIFVYTVGNDIYVYIEVMIHNSSFHGKMYIVVNDIYMYIEAMITIFVYTIVNDIYVYIEVMSQINYIRVHSCKYIRVHSCK